jgi:glycolate dehydrogenase iron-sulfur subunit
LRSFARRTGLLRLVPSLARAEAQLPERSGRPIRAGSRLPGSAADADRHALLFTGCIMGELFGDVHRATARVLMRRRVAVTAIEGQLCCGALHAHDGDVDFAKTLAKRNIEVFERHEGEIVVNSAGCGAAMKEYGELLQGDEGWSERAAKFSARVVDFAELAARLPGPGGAAFDGSVAYQDPCHLANVQGIRDEPRKLLSEIAGCELLPEDDGMCCGAAGLYGVLEPRMAAELRERKEERFSKLSPDVIVTANPGCQIQYGTAVRNAGLSSRVMHLAEFMDEAEKG